MRQLALVAATGLLGLFFSSSVFGDVFPGACCTSTTVVTAKAWEECGWHGPRYQMSCEAPLECFVVTAPKAPHTHVCTRACNEDRDCAALGAGFSCSGSGHPTPSGAGDNRICARGGE